MGFDRRWSFTCNRCGKKQTRRIGRAGYYVTCKAKGCRQVNPGPAMVGGLATAGTPKAPSPRKATIQTDGAPAQTRLGGGASPSPHETRATAPASPPPPENPTPHTPARAGGIFGRFRELAKTAAYGESGQ